MSLFAGALGALGALGIILAFTYGGSPTFVMPLVFGGAPVVNAFLTIYLSRKFGEIGPMFLAGLMMVLLGAVTVLVCKPASVKHAAAPAAVAAGDAAAPTNAAEPPEAPVAATPPKSNFLLQVLTIASVVACWGAYGPVLHQGQAAMGHSRLRPLLCVGLAYFAIAVVVPQLMLMGSFDEPSTYSISGTLWSLASGAAGALGALGIILAFNYGGKPVYVMPLVFGGAPVITTLETLWVRGGFEGVPTTTLGGFFAGLLLVIAGAAIVLVFAPRGGAPKPAAVIVEPTPTPSPPA